MSAKLLPPKLLPLSRRDFYTFTDLEGFTAHVSRLVHMLEYVRANTLQAVAGLTTRQLDLQLFPNGNTIGMLLAHIAGIERSYQAVTFRGEYLSPDLPEFALGETGRAHFQGRPLGFYLERLTSARAETLEQLRQRDDEWLHHTYQPWGPVDWSNDFCWFHVAEDEMRHQGQIVILAKEIKRREVERSAPAR